MPDPTALPSTNPSSSQGESARGKGEEDPWANDRQEIGGALQKAGQQVAQAGGQMGQASAGGPSGTADGQSGGGGIDAEIRQAQEALEKAGGVLQEAGDAIMTAETDAEIAAAEAALAKARVAVIVAGEDLNAATAAGAESAGTSDAREALGNADRAIVVATQAVIAARGELPGGGGSHESDSPLDEELDESLAIFDGEMQQARQAVLDSAPPPTDVDNPANETLPGGGIGGDEPGMEESGEEGDGTVPVQTGRMPGPAEVASAAGTESGIPEDIPDAQGDDIVAQQLREAAMAETDPELQKKLWEEYRRYKEGISN